MIFNSRPEESVSVPDNIVETIEQRNNIILVAAYYKLCTTNGRPQLHIIITLANTHTHHIYEYIYV